MRGAIWQDYRIERDTIMKRYVILYSICALLCWISESAAEFGNDSMKQSADEIRVVNRYIDDNELHVARGRLVKDTERDSLPRWHATYEIGEVNRGHFDRSRISIRFSPDTLRGELPDDAILILHSSSVYDTHRNYKAAGNDASRGILPFDEDVWMAVTAKSSRELGRTAENERLPLEEAVEVAISTAKTHHYHQGEVDKVSIHPQRIVSRRNFSWSMMMEVLMVPPENTNVVWIFNDLIEVYDDGRVKYGPDHHPPSEMPRERADGDAH